MAMRIKKVGRLRKKRGKQIGWGILEVDGVEINFRVYPSKDGGVFGSMPSVKKQDGSWFNQVQFSTKEKAREFEELLNQAWDRNGSGEKNSRQETHDDELPF